MSEGGYGIPPGGVPEVSPAKFVIIGGGVAGTPAAQMALGLGADVTILDVNLERFRYLDDVFGSMLKTCYSEPLAIEELSEDADLLIGFVLIPGKQAPKLLERETIGKMKRGSAFVDVAIDHGGCAETSRSTTDSEPTYVESGAVHHCVGNMPAAYARTSTLALTNALPFALEIATKGYGLALRESPGLRNGLNVHMGCVTQKKVASDLGYEWVSPEAVLAGSQESACPPSAGHAPETFSGFPPLLRCRPPGHARPARKVPGLFAR